MKTGRTFDPVSAASRTNMRHASPVRGQILGAAIVVSTFFWVGVAFASGVSL